MPLKNTEKSTIHEDSVLGETAIISKIKKWRMHLKKADTSGFRKASKKTMSSVGFAKELVALIGRASGNKTPGVQRMLHKLIRAAKSSPKEANRILSELTDSRTLRQSDKPRLKSPREASFPEDTYDDVSDGRTWGEERKFLNPPTNEELFELLDTPADQLTPEEQEKLDSYYYRKGSRVRNAAGNPMIRTRQWVEDYATSNNIDPKEMEILFSDPNVKDGWASDMESQGLDPNDEECQEAWNVVRNTYIEDTEDDAKALEPDYIGPDDKELGVISMDLHNSPGGDWANDVFEPNSVMDHSTGRKSSKEKKKLLTEAIENAIEYYASSMHPTELSEEHVKDFCKKHYPMLNSDNVFDGIMKIVDGPSRHEKEEKTGSSNTKHTLYKCIYCGGDAYDGVPGEDIRFRGSAKCTGCGKSFSVIKMKPSEKQSSVRVSTHKTREVLAPEEQLDRLTKTGTKRYKVACGVCGGSAVGDSGTCTNCSGLGYVSSSKKASKLLLVDLRNTETAYRNKVLRIARAKNSRYAELIPTRDTILTLKSLDIPYKYGQYKHPLFSRDNNRP